MEALFLPQAKHAKGSLRLPGSKSISNRTLLLAALSRGDTTLTGVLDSDDTRVMRGALDALGVRIEEIDGPSTCACTASAAPAAFPRSARRFSSATRAPRRVRWWACSPWPTANTS
jgi:3-phosphoshikimate 1-carboxyvinyltransferase